MYNDMNKVRKAWAQVRALDHPFRMMLINYLLENRFATVQKIEEDLRVNPYLRMSQSALSQQLEILTNRGLIAYIKHPSGFVKGQGRGFTKETATHHKYYVDERRLGVIINSINSFVGKTKPVLA